LDGANLAKELEMEPEMTKDDLVRSTLKLTDKAFRELFPILPKEWLSLDLTMPQLKVVLLLFTNGPERMSTIASALGVSLATATGVVDRLVEKDMVTREGDPNDRRIVLIRLSGKGEKLLAGLWQLARVNTEALLKALDQRKLQLLNEALRALLEAGEVVKGELQSNNKTK
jgi:DNA-binding MarR family transcriptional regulator